MAARAIRVALTFDAEHPDRPTQPDVHDGIVSALDRHGVRATFFVQGRWAEAYPARARELPEHGHLIGNHSFYHARMTLLSPTGLRSDVRRAERVMRDAVHVDPRPWFRLPFGTGADDGALALRLQRLGYRHVHWDVSAGDWRRRVTPRRLADEVVAGVLQHGDGAVVLMHSWPAVTLAALPDIVGGLRAAGAQFATVDELQST